jgi:hypothetical protein
MMDMARDTLSIGLSGAGIAKSGVKALTEEGKKAAVKTVVKKSAITGANRLTNYSIYSSPTGLAVGINDGLIAVYQAALERKWTEIRLEALEGWSIRRAGPVAYRTS